jgi:hypothetical protein
VIIYREAYDIGIVPSAFLVKLVCICFCAPYLRLVKVDFQLEVLIPALHMRRITFKYFGVLY